MHDSLLLLFTAFVVGFYTHCLIWLCVLWVLRFVSGYLRDTRHLLQLSAFGAPFGNPFAVPLWWAHKIFVIHSSRKSAGQNGPVPSINVCLQSFSVAAVGHAPACIILGCGPRTPFCHLSQPSSMYLCIQHRCLDVAFNELCHLHFLTIKTSCGDAGCRTSWSGSGSDTQSLGRRVKVKIFAFHSLDCMHVPAFHPERSIQTLQAAPRPRISRSWIRGSGLLFSAIDFWSGTLWRRLRKANNEMTLGFWLAKHCGL